MFTLSVLASESVGTTILCLLLSAGLGAIFAVTYALTNRKEGYDKSMLVCLIILPLIIAVLIMLVKDDIAKVFSLGGVFVLMRFKVKLNNFKDVAYVASIIAVGFACGLLDYLMAIIIALAVLVILVVLHLIKLDTPNPATFRLKVLVPENLDYVGAFDGVFTKYLKSSSLKKVKTTDFGSLTELSYVITMIDPSKQKAFIDELRQKNGNLNIVLANDWEKLIDAAN